MNPFFVIILIAIILEFVISLVADLLNLKALKLEVPAAVKGIYKPDEYRNSQQYTRIITRFAFVTSSFRLALLLAFWFGGGFNYLDQVIRSSGHQVMGICPDCEWLVVCWHSAVSV
jgi:STE24 endopeptidase